MALGSVLLVLALNQREHTWNEACNARLQASSGLVRAPAQPSASTAGLEPASPPSATALPSAAPSSSQASSTSAPSASASAGAPAGDPTVFTFEFEHGQIVIKKPDLDKLLALLSQLRAHSNVKITFEGCPDSDMSPSTAHSYGARRTSVLRNVLTNMPGAATRMAPPDPPEDCTRFPGQGVVRLSEPMTETHAP